MIVLASALLGALVVGLLLLAGWLVNTARRLDRLHVRRDLAWQALLAALDRRALVARTAAARLGPQGGELARLARAVEAADVADRERLESELSVCLGALGAEGTDALGEQLVEERADAEARVRFARSFYNEAVRDTLALRARSAVRLFKLAGSAPLPAYFEIVEGAGPLVE
ncbi:hypothetical protein [Segniliparus rugosus]|uniref:NUDIX hydrolase n=1 Tax=Segniliparus rugosus (strain ATCC BAA-974 / DSM 45345 / CCUG 50838 / CIP 108380 / JCM 13579 / CDC 945) TaxID=679197 RepID=E5XNR7_SEGRC|nr:hypothetical protein [Segniliparus rugosus]EFV14006.1 hypothetical protein HMPREF9336_01138 [Segniliparus rugosus ATCC BAA-974]